MFLYDSNSRFLEQAKICFISQQGSKCSLANITVLLCSKPLLYCLKLKLWTFFKGCKIFWETSLLSGRSLNVRHLQIQLLSSGLNWLSSGWRASRNLLWTNYGHHLLADEVFSIAFKMSIKQMWMVMAGLVKFSTQELCNRSFNNWKLQIWCDFLGWTRDGYPLVGGQT